MVRRRLKHAIAALAACLAIAGADAQNPLARGSAVSPADCAATNDMVGEFAPAPTDRTYMRVQHMGDPGTEELERQVANIVTWDVGAVTGFDVPAQAQRGYGNEPPPAGTSAFQLLCNGAGFFINTFRFSHRSPLVGEGPNVSVARDFTHAFPAFRDGASLVIEATVRVPWLRNQRTPVVTAGTAQVGFFYYAQDSRTGTVIAHLLAAFDNRPPGVNGSGVESWGSDGVVAFVSSPIAPVDAFGNPVRFLSYTAASATMQFERPWPEARRFTVRITPRNFGAALELLRAGPLPGISGDPADYRILSFGLLAEVFPGTGDEDNVSLGGSVTDLVLREVPLARARMAP
jgi:hypothetical protein